MPFALAGLLLTFVGTRPLLASDSEIDQFEDRAVARHVERAMRSEKADRALWLKELDHAYPGRVTNALTEEDYAGWFALVAGKLDEWRKESAASAHLEDLYQRVAQRLELGPVPSIKKDEFARYVRKALIPGNPPKDGKPAPDRHEDADKVFRVLDRNGDGLLDKEELTLRLRDERVRVDEDGNGRIDRDEYRLYFHRRVTLALETTSARSSDRNARGSEPKATNSSTKAAAALPEWFATLDTDMDGQVALHEWRKAGRTIETFTEMDLDGDGLLTREEYLRFARKLEADAARAAGSPVPGKQAKK